MTTTNAAALAAQKGSFARGWPSLVLTVLVLLAALYSFSHRPPPPFAATQVHPSGLLINALAHQGDRWLAVGEQGHILVADDAEGPWRAAQIAPHRESTLTAVRFVAPKVAVAVGHDAWILRSEDGGETWKEVAFSAEQSDPLLGIAGPYDGKLYAHGAFGKLMVSSDLGATWSALALVEEGGAKPAAAAPPRSDPEDEDYDPFAAYTRGGGGNDDGSLSERHLNAMLQSRDGTLWLAGERGLLARSSNGGETWKVLEPVYAGSWFGLLELPSGGILVHGMRGNVYVSRNGGANWTKAQVPMPLSLFSGAIDGDGNVMLVGAADAIFKSTDNGMSFTLVSQQDRRSIASIIPLQSGGWLTGGEAGIKRQWPRDERADSASATTGGVP
ncbi:MAG TPA: hypothetical protein VGE57_11005 [Solimonas sp.]